ncbi:hypothetical protein [Algibacter sp. 2305UL17-15]|uniref:hypothetical protein n=1 Tax=Algibacter sp. 2305UL17-15 TaxID=3231268 RepID=UPI00345AABCC
MNRKYLNTTLIILLVIIWGSVFYKYFGGKKSLEENLYLNNLVSNNTKKYNITKDTFQLKLITKDPFGVSTIKKVHLSKPSIKKSTKKNKPFLDKKIVWPKISYHGFVKSENNETPLILLKIDNKVYRKREGEVVRDITLVKVHNDSVIISLNNNIKTIKR